MRHESPRTVQPGIFFLGRTFVHDEQRLPGGHPHAEHPAALRRGRFRRLLPARHRQIQPRRPAGRRGRFLDGHPAQSRLHAGLHLPRHHALASGQLRRRFAGLPRGDRAAPRPAGPLLQPRRDAPAEPAVQGGHRRFRQVHPPGEQGGRRLHLPGISTPRYAPTARIPTATTAAADCTSSRNSTRRPRRISTRPSSAIRPTCSPTSTARWSTTPPTARCRRWPISTR